MFHRTDLHDDDGQIAERPAKSVLPSYLTELAQAIWDPVPNHLRDLEFQNSKLKNMTPAERLQCKLDISLQYRSTVVRL
jgi:hypothetical protein